MLGRSIDLGNPVTNHTLNDGLVSWWLPLPSNLGGGTLFDLKGKINGTLTNGPTWAGGPTGCGSSVLLDGSDDYVGFGDVTTFDGFTSLTIAGWFRPDSIANTASGRRWVSKWGDAVGEWSFILSQVDGDGGKLVWVVGNPAQGALSGYQTTNTVLTANVWTHIVATWVGPGDAFAIYVNGVAVAQTLLAAQSVAIIGDSSSHFRFGLDSDSVNGLLGAMTDVRAYSRALTASDAYRLYEQSLRGNPDTLRRWSRRAYLFDSIAGGGGGFVPFPRPRGLRGGMTALCGGRH